MSDVYPIFPEVNYLRLKMLTALFITHTCPYNTVNHSTIHSKTTYISSEGGKWCQAKGICMYVYWFINFSFTFPYSLSPLCIVAFWICKDENRPGWMVANENCRGDIIYRKINTHSLSGPFVGFRKLLSPNTFKIACLPGWVVCSQWSCCVQLSPESP